MFSRPSFPTIISERFSYHGIIIPIIRLGMKAYKADDEEFRLKAKLTRFISLRRTANSYGDQMVTLSIFLSRVRTFQMHIVSLNGKIL